MEKVPAEKCGGGVRSVAIEVHAQAMTPAPAKGHSASLFVVCVCVCGRGMEVGLGGGAPYRHIQSHLKSIQRRCREGVECVQTHKHTPAGHLASLSRWRSTNTPDRQTQAAFPWGCRMGASTPWSDQPCRGGRGGRRVAGTDCVIYLPAPISLIRCSCCSHPARRVGRPSPGSRHLPPRSQMLVLQQPRPAGGTPL